MTSMSSMDSVAGNGSDFQEVASDDESFHLAPFDDADDGDDPLFDHQQDVARATFDDMVNDQERNQLFYLAIEKSIRTLRDQNRSTWTLDIGSGTGLLSMMAIKAGAQRVLACECFKPMAECSRRIIAQNGMADSISVVNKRSTELVISGPEDKPNLLVAELLDTEMIGEGCLFTYRDAIKRLLDPAALMVPARGRIWVQLVQSEYLFRYHQFVTPSPIKIPPAASNCFGSHLLHDIHLNRLEPGRHFEILTDEPVMAFEFEFNRLETLKLKDHRRLCFPLRQKFSQPLALLFWWDIDMDAGGEYRLSCAPDWARPAGAAERQSWREHWIQTVYFLPAFAFDLDRPVDGFHPDQINGCSRLWVDAYHDSFSFWFDLPAQDGGEPEPLSSDAICDAEPWSCICGLHSHLSRNRLCQMNDQDRYQAYFRAICANLEASAKTKMQILYLGDESLLPLICALNANVERVLVLVMSRNSLRFFRQFRRANNLEDRMKLCSVKELRGHNRLQVDGIVSELYFQNQASQLSCLQYFWLMKKLGRSVLNTNPFILPHRIVFRCLVVRFEHLWKCYSPVGSKVCGHFDLREYDRLVQKARRAVDWSLEPRFLCEYQCYALVEHPLELFSLSLNDVWRDDDGWLRRTIAISTELMDVDPNTVAIVLWYDQHLCPDDDDAVIPGGPIQPVGRGEEISWVHHQPQYVGFPGADRWPESGAALNLQFELSIDQQRCSLAFG